MTKALYLYIVRIITCILTDITINLLSNRYSKNNKLFLCFHRYGRYNMVIGGLVLNIIVSVTGAFIPTYTAFVILKFLQAFTNAVAYMAAFVLGKFLSIL